VSKPLALPPSRSLAISSVDAVTIEAPDELFRPLARAARNRLGFMIDPHHFAILGHCESCG
jgi:Fe2+ or Zn2+ uptake regulation protein